MSYVAIYWAANGGYLLGGVQRGRSSRHGTREEAQNTLDTTTEINAGVGNTVEGYIIRSPLPPQSFAHCLGHWPQVVGGRCFGCRKVLTKADAIEYERLQNERFPQETAVHYEPLYQVVRAFGDGSVGPRKKKVILRNLTLIEAQAHCRNPETSSKTATSKAARERTRRCGPWVDQYDEQKIYKRGVGWVQDQREVSGTAPEVQTKRLHRFSSTRPHGRCGHAGRCIEHEIDPSVEACR